MLLQNNNSKKKNLALALETKLRAVGVLRHATLQLYMPRSQHS
jgi:hypothetical protein